MKDITSQSLTDLVKNIKNKNVSSEEVTKSFIQRAEKSKKFHQQQLYMVYAKP